jgi:ATP-dependent Clp protease ATP-binding subunit ClpB
MAKELADIVFGSRNHLITFDMSEYTEAHAVSRLLGSPPGYVGSEEDGRLAAAVKDNPFCILLFDEIEKAHRSIFDIFLPIFDEGRLKDHRGRNVDFKNSIIILTSNVGADALYRSDNGNSEETILNALSTRFRPEFINRIDEFVPFYPLLFEDIRLILRHSIDELRRRLAEKGIGIRMYQRAYEYIAEKGYSPQFGARELRRAVDRLVIHPISEKILREEFRAGDMIDVMMEGEQLVFRKGEPHSREIASA